MHQKINKGSNTFAGAILFFLQVVLILFLPTLMFANGSSNKDSIEQIKSESYKLLGEKDYEGFLRKIDHGKKYALTNRDTSNYVEFLNF